MIITNIELIILLMTKMKPSDLSWPEFMWDTDDLNYACMQRIYDYWITDSELNIPKELTDYFSKETKLALSTPYSIFSKQ